MRFGEGIRELRKSKNLVQRTLGETVGVSFTYVSKIENGKLDLGEHASEELIRKLADALDGDEDELLILAKPPPPKDSGRGSLSGPKPLSRLPNLTTRD